MYSGVYNGVNKCLQNALFICAQSLVKNKSSRLN